MAFPNVWLEKKRNTMMNWQARFPKGATFSDAEKRIITSINYAVYAINSEMDHRERLRDAPPGVVEPDPSGPPLD